MIDQTKPTMRSYLAAAPDLASGKQTPRQFLEDSLVLLDQWEPRIGAFVYTNLPHARAAADRSTERWRAGKPASPIDGMPVGIKDIIETVDMPTEMGSALFAGAVAEGRRERSRATRCRRRHRRQDRDHGVCGLAAARHAQSVERGAHARWIVERLGGLRGGRHRQRCARHPGHQFDGPSRELLRLRRLQADGERDQPPRQP